ncbi:MAG TPA: hypothetical protein VFR47_17665 [Anaerolineales bacterium]|nr:hypothetical protein [Anaerolineales bacterium]
MKLSTLLIINAVVALTFALGCLLVPMQLLSFYGATTDAAGLLVTRYFGAALGGISLLAWLARKVADREAQQAVILTLLVTWVLTLVVDLLGQFSGVLNAFSWSTVVLAILFVAAFSYFLFLKPRTA